MESSAAVRSLHYSAGIALLAQGLEKPRVIHFNHSNWCIPSTPYAQCLVVGGNINSSKRNRNVTQICCTKSPEAAAAAEKSVAVSPETNASKEKKPSRIATFPSGFEDLMLEICDETEIAEVKMKIGDFEMHLKRNIGAAKAPMSTISPTTAPPIPTEPMIKSAPASPPPPSTSTEKINPFTNVSYGTSSRLAALDASGIDNYVLVTSPTVGTFRRSRTVKGKKLPPGFKEGDLIKEGQVIGYLDQFGTELPVRSDVAGEVLKLLVDDGDAVGYGDPLIAVLPSFHGINNVM